MKNIILAILLFSVNVNAAHSQNKPTTKKEQAQPTKSLVNASTKDECEQQGGTWRGGSCYTH